MSNFFLFKIMMKYGQDLLQLNAKKGLDFQVFYVAIQETNLMRFIKIMEYPQIIQAS